MTPISKIVQPFLQLLVDCNEFDLVGSRGYVFYHGEGQRCYECSPRTQ